MKFANNSKSVACGQWTSEMKTHFKVSITHCSDNDKFNKKIGKDIAEIRMDDEHFIVLPAKFEWSGDKVNLKTQLKWFLDNNC
jgi:hypothetical protein